MKNTGCNNSKHPLLPIITVNFIGSLSFAIVIPFLVFLVERFGGNAIIYGLINSMYPAFQLVGGPILGRWSDIHGRKKILLVSQVGTLLSWIIFLCAFFLPLDELIRVDSAITGSFILTLPLIILFIARSLDGITGGNVAVANAYLADITGDKDRSKNFGKMSIASNLGFIIGPALAGVLSMTTYGEMIPVIATIVISIAGTIIIGLFIPATTHCISRQQNKIKLKHVMQIQNIPFILILYFFIFLGFNIFYTSFPIHAIEVLKWSVTDMGIYFSFLSIIMVIVQGPVLASISKRFRDSQLVIAGSMLLGTNFLLLTPGDLVLTYIAAVFFAFGNGIMWPSILSIISKLAGVQYQGSVQGFASSFSSMAAIIGLIVGGIIYEIFQAKAFVVTSLIIYIVFILSFRLLKLEDLNHEKY